MSDLQGEVSNATSYPTDYAKRVQAMHFANGDVTRAQAIYAFFTDGASAPAVKAPPTPKADKPKAEAPAEQPKAEQPKAELTYASDIMPRVLATANAIAALPGNDINSGRAALVAMMQQRFNVSKANEVKPADWPALLAACAELMPKEAANV